MAGFNNSAEFPPTPSPEGESPWLRRFQWMGKLATISGATLVAVETITEDPVTGPIGVGLLLSGVFVWTMATFGRGFNNGGRAP